VAFRVLSQDWTREDLGWVLCPRSGDVTGMKKTAEIVIIGGGIMGLSTAYHLAKRGCRDVVLLERDLLAQASTGLSLGGFRQQFSVPANIRLSQESVRIFENFQGEFETDINFRQVGYLFLVQQEKTWEEFLAGVKRQKKYHVPVEVCTPQDIKHRWPYLEVSDVIGATFGPEDGYADPYLTAMGFARAARRLGVRIEEKTEVVDLEVDKGRIQGVKTARGSLSTRVVINVAGAWGGQVAKMAGVLLPVKPFRRQVFMTQAFEAIPKPVPMIIDMDVSFYLRGEGPGILMGLSDPEEPSSFNVHVDWNFMERVIEAAVHRVPQIETAKILRGWAGLYAITPDQNPIIGPIPKVEGFYVAVGFSGHGFQQGPAVGRLLSELVLDGRIDFDLRAFAHDRFEKKRTIRERRVV